MAKSGCFGQNIRPEPALFHKGLISTNQRPLNHQTNQWESLIRKPGLAGLTACVLEKSLKNHNLWEFTDIFPKTKINCPKSAFEILSKGLKANIVRKELPKIQS